MSEIKIRDLYTGKPDAKDEINFEGLEEFIKTFVVADHFQLDSLLYGNNCFITGFKGTGKTALLFYLDNKLKDEDPITCTSFIFFKEEFTDAKRDELQAISNRFLSSISVEPGALLDIREFEYICRWLIFKRIVSDNEDNHRNLFVDNEINYKEEQLMILWKDIISCLERKNIKWKIYTNGLQADNEFVLKFIKKYGYSKEKIILPSTPRELVKTIASFRGIIATRLHSCIVAYSLKVPAIGLVWNQKLKMFGDEKSSLFHLDQELGKREYKAHSYKN